MIFFYNFINFLVVTNTNMKHIFSIIIIWFFTIASVFAEDTVRFYSDKKEYDIEDIIQLQVVLKTDTSWENDITIEWIEKFQIISQRQSQNNVNINGEQQSSVILNISMLSPEKWEYTFWPVRTWTWELLIESNSLDISITGERIMVNNKFDNVQKNLWIQKSQEDKKQEPEEDIDDVDLGNWIKNASEEIEIIPEKIIWVDWEEMTDIYREKWFLTSYAFLKKVLSIIAIIIATIIWVILWKKYLKNYLASKKEKREEEPEEEIIEEKIEINYQELLNNIKLKYIDCTKELFYSKTSELYRTYLDDQVQEWLSKWSLDEVQKYFKRSSIEWDLKNKLLKFYTRIYFPEYNNKKDTLAEREDILEDLENIIIVKEFK